MSFEVFMQVRCLQKSKWRWNRGNKGAKMHKQSSQWNFAPWTHSVRIFRTVTVHGAKRSILDDSHDSHFWSTSRSPFRAYHMSFQSLGSQESIASNGTRFGFKMKNLWPFEDKRAKLSENFAAETPFGRVFRSCETNFWHTSAICSIVPFILKLRYTCEITFELWNGCEMISKLQNGGENAPSFRNGLRNFPLPAKWSPNFKMATKSPPNIEKAFKLQNWLAKWRMIYKNTLQS